LGELNSNIIGDGYLGENVLFISLQLVLFAFSLLILGEPLRHVLSRCVRLFGNLVPLQVALLDVYLGGLILYVIAMVPLHVFSQTVTCLALVVSAGSMVMLNRRKIWKLRERRIQSYWRLLQNNKSTVFESLIVVSMFLAYLGIQVFSVRNFIFGSIHDASLHALFAQVTLENQQVPATLQPYMPEGIVYPQAPHVIFAYASYIVGWEPAKSVLYVSNLFNAFSVLGAYYLGKKLWPESRLGVSLAFLFAFVSIYPQFITWGSNALVVGFPFFFITLSLLPFFYRLEGGLRVKELVIIGVLLGYLAVLYLLLYEVIILSAMLVLVSMSLRYRSRVRRRLGHFLIVLGVSILPMSAFLLRYVQFYIYPGYNPGALSDLPRYKPATVWPMSAVLEWPFESQHPFLHSELWFLFILSVGVVTLVFLTDRRDDSMRDFMRVTLPTFCAILILTYSTYLPISSIVPLEVATIIELVVPIYLTISVFNVKLGSLLQRGKAEINRVFAGATPLTAVVMIFLVIYTPFIYYGVSQYPQTLASSYGLFAITTQDDYNLMVWMRDHMSRDVVILVNPDEAGSFIPVVSHLRVVLPFTGNRRSPSYWKLAGLIQQQVLDSTVFELMKRFNITHVYVGAESTYWWDRETKWDPHLFLQNRDKFELIHDIGNAYLFRVRY